MHPLFSLAWALLCSPLVRTSILSFFVVMLAKNPSNLQLYAFDSSKYPVLSPHADPVKFGPVYAVLLLLHALSCVLLHRKTSNLATNRGDTIQIPFPLSVMIHDVLTNTVPCNTCFLRGSFHRFHGSIGSFHGSNFYGSFRETSMETSMELTSTEASSFHDFHGSFQLPWK